MPGIISPKVRKMGPLGAIYSAHAVGGLEEFISAVAVNFQEAAVCGMGTSGRFNWLQIYYLG